MYIMNKEVMRYHIDRYTNYKDYNDYKDYKDYKQIIGSLNELSLNEKSKVYKQGLDQSYEKITDPISDIYIPRVEETSITDDINKNMNEYTIINTYKNILNRQPTSVELRKLLDEFRNEKINDETLKTRLYNSVEYKMIEKMQSNDVDPGLISTVSSIKLIDKLKKIYNEELRRDIDGKMISPLKDCYIHLQYNDYLFRAMLRNVSYNSFEKKVLETNMLTKEKMLEIFNNYFLLSELRIDGNRLMRNDLLSMKSRNMTKPVGIDNNIGSGINSSNMMGVDKQISKIVEDGNNVFNININLNSDDINNSSIPYSNDELRMVRNSLGDVQENVNGANSKKGTYRVYDPIKYKQQYRGDMRYRPNVCSYGTKQVVQPIFVNSSTLFQGTDLKEASENTQVGSIMPKFEYREYEDVPINSIK